jgi:integrase
VEEATRCRIWGEGQLFTDRHGRALTGNRKLFERLKTRTAIRDLCVHRLRHTWAAMDFHRSGSESKFDMQVEGACTTGGMVERYCKPPPLEERRNPSVVPADDDPSLEIR